MTLVSPTNKSGYKQELDRSAYTTKRVCYSLKRMGSINYLELYRSAYTTKRTLVSSTKKEFMNYLEFYTSAYTDQKTWASPTNNDGYKQELDRSTYTTK